MMKVLYLTKYSRLGASSRLRSYQYFPFLEEEGFLITVKPLFNDEYLNNLYKGEKSIIAILHSYFKRFFILFTLTKYDRIVIEKELFPYFPAFFEKIIYFIGIKYIVDYDDAIFHNYDLSNNGLIKLFLKNKIDNVMNNSSCVIAGNSYLAKRAKKAGAKKIEIIPTVIDLSRYSVLNKNQKKSFIIGWIGSPSTFKYVKKIEAALKKIAEKYNVTLHIIGANESLDLGSDVKYIQWTEESEVSEIQKFDLGIMPLENTPWELGKCSYKLIQYMGCGIPVIASPIGMNNEVVKHSENGFFANTDGEWFSFIEKLILDKNLNILLGESGRSLVRKKYSLQSKINKLMMIIKK